MLNALKKQASSWIAQLFIGLLVLSFAVWGIGNAFTGFQADTVATVGETEVSTIEFARQYDRALQNATRNLGRPVTPDQAQLFGLPGQVLSQLVLQATIDDTARQFGLGISDEILRQEITEDPVFRGVSGGFERIQFTQVLRNAGLNEDQYVENQRAVLLRYQISNALVGGASAPESYLRAFHEFRTQERDISYLVLNAAAAEGVGEPSDSALNAYFDENIEQWRAPEYRALSLFAVTPADIADPDEISDEQAQTAYDANARRYIKVERRRVSQMHFDTEAAADAAALELAGEKTFDEIVAERNLSAEDVSLGLVTRNQIIDQKIAEAAFSLLKDATSDVVEGDFGWFIARVEEIQPEEVRTFAEVKDELKQSMALDLATRRIIGTFDEVEDSRAGGETLAEVAAKIGAKLQSIESVDLSGNNANGDRIADLPGANAVVVGAFGSDVGIENDAIRTEQNGYVWYEVTAVTVERGRVLEEVREDVVTAWKQAQVDTVLAAKADDILTRLETGEPIEVVAEKMELNVGTATKLTRSTQPPDDLSVAAVSAAFDGPKGHVAVADGAGDDGTKIVLVVSETTVPSFNPDSADLTAMRTQIAGQIANDYFGQFLAQQRQQLGVSVNQISMQSVVSGQPLGYQGRQPIAPPRRGM